MRYFIFLIFNLLLVPNGWGSGETSAQLEEDRCAAAQTLSIPLLKITEEDVSQPSGQFMSSFIVEHLHLTGQSWKVFQGDSLRDVKKLTVDVPEESTDEFRDALHAIVTRYTLKHVHLSGPQEVFQGGFLHHLRRSWQPEGRGVSFILDISNAERDSTREIAGENLSHGFEGSHIVGRPLFVLDNFSQLPPLLDRLRGVQTPDKSPIRVQLPTGDVVQPALWRRLMAFKAQGLRVLGGEDNHPSFRVETINDLRDLLTCLNEEVMSSNWRSLHIYPVGFSPERWSSDETEVCERFREKLYARAIQGSALAVVFHHRYQTEERQYREQEGEIIECDRAVEALAGGKRVQLTPHITWNILRTDKVEDLEVDLQLPRSFGGYFLPPEKRVSILLASDLIQLPSFYPLWSVEIQTRTNLSSDHAQRLVNVMKRGFTENPHFKYSFKHRPDEKEFMRSALGMASHTQWLPPFMRIETEEEMDAFLEIPPAVLSSSLVSEVFCHVPERQERLIQHLAVLSTLKKIQLWCCYAGDLRALTEMRQCKEEIEVDLILKAFSWNMRRALVSFFKRATGVRTLSLSWEVKREATLNLEDLFLEHALPHIKALSWFSKASTDKVTTCFCCRKEVRRGFFLKEGDEKIFERFCRSHPTLEMLRVNGTYYKGLRSRDGGWWGEWTRTLLHTAREYCHEAAGVGVGRAYTESSPLLVEPGTQVPSRADFYRAFALK